MEFLTDFQHAWNTPSMRHAMLVHWPIVLSVLTIIVSLVMAIDGAKNKSLRLVTMLLCLAVMASGFLAKNSGQNAENAVQNTTDQAEDLLEEHEELGEKVWLFGAICTVLVMVSCVPRKPVRISAAWLSFIACGFTGAWVANTAHHGGLLVYEQGVGMPAGESERDEPDDSPKPVNGSATIDTDDPVAVMFAQQVQPILNDRCVRCHNPDKVAAGKSGRFDQSSLAALLKGGRSGPAIVPGKPEESLLIKRIRQEISGDDVMPPPPAERLTAEQILAIEQWIRTVDAANR